MKSISITLSLLGFVVLSVWGGSSESPEISPINKSVDQAIDAGDVVAMRPLTLRQGADSKAFEKYVAEVYTPAFDRFVPGVQSFVMRAERGKNQGEYVHVYVFDSADTRDYYFPKEGEGLSEAGTALWSQLPEFELDDYLEPPDTTIVNYTDYVVID